MYRNKIKKAMVVVSPIVIFALLFYIIYIETGIGLVSEYKGYTPMYAPFWFEAIVTILFLPYLVYEWMKEKYING